MADFLSDALPFLLVSVRKYGSRQRQIIDHIVVTAAELQRILSRILSNWTRYLFSCIANLMHERTLPHGSK